MAKNKPDKNFNDIRACCDQIWQWLRSLPEYRADYYKQLHNRISAEELYKRWGFHRLLNPRFKQLQNQRLKKLNDDLGFVLLDRVDEATGTFREMPAVYSSNHPIKNSYFFSPSTGDCFNPYPELVKQHGLINRSFFFEVLPHKDIDLITTEFKNALKTHLKTCKFKPKRFRVGNFVPTYIASVLHNLGWSDKKIRNYLQYSRIGRFDETATQHESSRVKSHQAIRRSKKSRT